MKNINLINVEIIIDVTSIDTFTMNDTEMSFIIKGIGVRFSEANHTSSNQRFEDGLNIARKCCANNSDIKYLAFNARDLISLKEWQFAILDYLYDELK